MTILVTGCAGFIGMHVAKRLLERGDEVAGIDNLNPYYDVRLKEARLHELRPFERFRFTKLDLADRDAIARLFEAEKPVRVVNLAAQAGVRYSLQDPHAYVSSNLVGFTNVLEACRHGKIEHLVYASTSSVYGANVSIPFGEDDPVDHPVSLYAATKRANELMAHTYSHLFGLPTTGLRFFTVYGPWGRPDMSMALFTSAILAGEPIRVFNHGRMRRDFTYIDDIVEGVVRVLDVVPEARPTDAAGCVHAAIAKRGAVPHLQHREQPTGRAARVRPAAGSGEREAGDARSATDAARRCRGDRGGHVRPRGRSRISSRNAAQGGNQTLRRMAPRILRGAVIRDARANRFGDPPLRGLVEVGMHREGKDAASELLRDRIALSAE